MSHFEKCEIEIVNFEKYVNFEKKLTFEAFEGHFFHNRHMTKALNKKCEL